MKKRNRGSVSSRIRGLATGLDYQRRAEVIGIARFLIAAAFLLQVWWNFGPNR